MFSVSTVFQDELQLNQSTKEKTEILKGSLLHFECISSIVSSDAHVKNYLVTGEITHEKNYLSGVFYGGFSTKEVPGSVWTQ